MSRHDYHPLEKCQWLPIALRNVDSSSTGLRFSHLLFRKWIRDPKHRFNLTDSAENRRSQFYLWLVFTHTFVIFHMIAGSLIIDAEATFINPFLQHVFAFFGPILIDHVSRSIYTRKGQSAKGEEAPILFSFVQ